MSEELESKARAFTFLSVIPMLLGVAAIAWLSFWITGHDFNRQTSLEKRKNEAVGAKVLPVDPLKIEIQNSPRACLQIESVDLSQGLTFYWRNKCRGTLPYTDVFWKQISPDGTNIKSEWTNKPSYELGPGERGEYSMVWEKVDPRTVEFVIRVEQK